MQNWNFLSLLDKSINGPKENARMVIGMQQNRNSFWYTLNMVQCIHVEMFLYDRFVLMKNIDK